MISQIYKHYLVSRKVSTDTRKISEGSVFFALKGPNFNANRFADEAIEKGASIAVIDDADYKKDERYILVEDGLSALQELATYHRDRLSIPVIGLTGSNGKTTTKELIYTALSAKYNVLATKGNLNNHIGVPLTLLEITPEHEIAIIEMGANHVGEIALLCSLAKPSHGLITNIGKAHLEGFGGIEGVIRGKSELYDHLIKSNGTVWINSQDTILSNMAKRFKSPLFYPSRGDYYHCELEPSEYFVNVKAENGRIINTNLTGDYNFGNIAVALAIAKYFDVSDSEANSAISNYSPQNKRSQIIKKGSNSIILDSYNANPDSMAVALKNLDSISHNKKIIILGDMKELGESSVEEHRNLGELAAGIEPFAIYLCGPEIELAKETAHVAYYFKTREEIIEDLKQKPIENALILIKASRSIGLESIVDYL